MSKFNYNGNPFVPIEIGKNESHVNLSDLEPYTNYSCTGKIDAFELLAVNFSIDCGTWTFTLSQWNESFSS